MRGVQGLLIGLAGIVLGAGLAWAASDAGDFRGGYMFYSGELGDWNYPNAKDTKVLINIEGALAADIYRRMGSSTDRPDLSCGPEHAFRQRGEVECNLYDGKTVCSLNLDLRSGKIFGGRPC
jgi:hypothetical protein